MSKGLRTLVKERLLKDVFDLAGEKAQGWKILVVDSRSMSVMSSCVGMYDIMERRITIVESLDKKRAPFPDKGVIYLLEPTEESVDMLMADYEKGKKLLYGPDVLLFFLQRLPDELLEKIKFCRPMLKRLKALSEVNVDFMVKEERAYSFNMQDSFSAFYTRQGGQAAEEAVANRLVTVCATLNEYPHIRYLKDSAVCHSLATLFHKKMDSFVAQNPDWWYYGGGKDAQSSSRERGVLVLMDRAHDCLAPLIHDFHYQPMVHDLLNMTGDRITVDQETAADAEKTEQKDILLDEKDEQWVELRGMHIAKVIEHLSAKIRDIMSSSAGGAFGGGGDKKMSLSDMAAAMKALPEYREVMSKLSQHMHISHECMGAFGKQNLMDLSEIEQTLATGVDDEDQKPNWGELIDKMELSLHKMKDQKSRLRLLCIATLGPEKLGHEERNRLFDAADFARSDSQCLENLKVMGAKQAVKAEKAKSGGSGLFGGLRGKSSDDEGDEDESDVVESRYRPKIERVLKGLVDDSDPLSFDEYPSVMPMPEAANSGTAASARRKKKGESSARKTGGATKRWASSGSASGKKGKQSAFTGGRIITFTVGGMSYTEMTIARQIMEKEQREIIFGSTHFHSPKEFLDDLASLSA